jgi:hypothetical protein
VCYTPRGASWASANRRSILKTDERDVRLELGREEKFTAKSGGWDENRVFLEGDKLQVEVKNGRWVLSHLPAAPKPASAAPQHYFPTE